VVQRSNTYALLSWSATGDNGNVGTCAAYDLRYSTTAITAANFGSATSVGTPPAVLPAGSAQTYALTGLTASTTYYFAIKAVDAAGNWSAVSNVTSIATTATDQVAPARVSDLRTP
jgi:chitodextrinase